jgi:RNA polymerase sigma-70 factor, ECF subfamily
VDDIDADLVEALRRADPEGSEQLLECHGDRVYRLVLRITGVEEDAAEAVEDMLRTAARTIHTVSEESASGSWISRRAAKAAYQKLRMRRPHANELALDDVVPALDDGGMSAVRSRPRTMR